MGGPELPPLAGGASSRDPSPTRASPRGVAAPDESKLLPEIKSRASGYATAVPDNSREDAAQQQKKEAAAAIFRDCRYCRKNETADVGN